MAQLLARLDRLVSAGRSSGGLRDQSRRKSWPRRPTS